MVIMAENLITPDHVGKSILPYFKKYENDIRKILEGGHSYLCAIGNDKDDLEGVLKLWKFDAIGEVKVNKHFKSLDDKEYSYYNCDVLNTALPFEKPIFIHFDLYDKTGDILDTILTRNANNKIVLCHCGMNDLDDQKKAFEYAIKLQSKHPNLWLEISWVALEYFIQHPLELNRFENPDRVLVGVDMSRAMEKSDKDINKLYDDFRKLYKHFNVEQSLSNLFA